MENPTVEQETVKRKQSTTWQRELMEQKRFLEVVLKEPVSLARATEAGFTKPAIEKGLALIDKVEEANLDWQNKWGNKVQHYEVFRQGLKNLRETYMRHLKIARQLIDPEIEKGYAKSLRLKGNRPSAIEEILAYIREFYAVALAEKGITDKLKAGNITPEMMAQVQLLAEEVASNREQAKKSRLIAHRSTRERNDALQAFYQWFRPFRNLYALSFDPPVEEKAKATAKAK